MDEDLKRIAARIRSWRDEAGLTLQQLGDRSSVSASTIHKIENLQTVPTIAVLLKVANGLNRRPSELLAEVDVNSQTALLRRADRQRLKIDGRAEVEHLVGLIPRSQIDIWRVHLQPGAGTGEPESEAWQFHGEIVLLVEDGRLQATVGGEVYELEPGDSLHFDPSLPHSWIADGAASATVLIFAQLPDRLRSQLYERIAASASIESGAFSPAKAAT